MPSWTFTPLPLATGKRPGELKGEDVLHPKKESSIEVDETHKNIYSPMHIFLDCVGYVKSYYRYKGISMTGVTD